MGAGGALPNASTLAAEFAPFRRRPVAVTLTIVCVPFGGVVGGRAAGRETPRGVRGWRARALGGVCCGGGGRGAGPGQVSCRSWAGGFFRLGGGGHPPEPPPQK